MKIHSLKKTKEKSNIYFQYDVDFHDEKKTLWYCIENQYEDFVSELLDGPLVALLIPAMILGEEIRVSGTISEKLFYNLSGPYQHILKLVFPSLNKIKIYVDNVKSKSTRASGVATGFSCGLDSYCVLADHYLSDITNGYKVTHLLFNNVGSHGKGDKGQYMFEKRFQMVKPVADTFGLPVIKVNSNINEIYPNYRFKNIHTIRNASVPLILQNGIGRFLYGSGYSDLEVYIGPSDTINHIDPITLPYLSTEAIDLVSVGGQYTRVQKTIKVAEIEDSYANLNVCFSSSEGNCGKCSKCKRTLLTMEIAGLLERYSKSFNLEAYRKVRDRYIGQIIRNTNPFFIGKLNDPFMTEIVQFSRKMNFKFPFRSYIFAFKEYLLSLLKLIKSHKSESREYNR